MQSIPRKSVDQQEAPVTRWASMAVAEEAATTEMAALVEEVAGT